MGVFSAWIIKRSERLAAKFRIFRTFPLIRKIFKFFSIDMTYFTEHEPGMQVKKTPYQFIVTVRI